MSSAPSRAVAAASKLWYLKRLPLFTGFSPNELDDVQRRTEMRRSRKGDVLYLPGEPGNQVFMIKSGVVKISRVTPDGRELTLALLKSGDVFGELEVIEDEPRETQALSYNDVLLCVMQKPDFLRWMAKKPDLALRVTKLISLRRRVIENRIERLLFRSASEKIAALLLDLADEFGRREPAGILIELPLTHQELANLTGSVRETVSDLLLQFRDRRWLAVDRRRIRLLDVPALRREATR
jgi:CRP-like cAMP-binding protein